MHSLHLRTFMFRRPDPLKVRIVAILIAAVVCTALAPLEGRAQGLVITDCQGITRAFHETRGTELNKVQIQVSEASGAPSTGSPVQLTNNITGQTFTVQTNSGVAVFNGVPAGNYSMVVTGTNLSAGTITVGSTGLGAVAAGGVVAGGVAAGGGAVIGGVAVVDEVESQIAGDSKPTPTPTPTPEVTENPAPIQTPIPPTPEPTPTPCDCVPDAEPTPLDNFFDGQTAPATRHAKAISPYR